MKTDKERILKFAKRMGFHVDCFTEPSHINDDARNAGAVESISFGYGKGATSKARCYSNLNFEINKKTILNLCRLAIFLGYATLLVRGDLINGIGLSLFYFGGLFKELA